MEIRFFLEFECGVIFNTLASFAINVQGLDPVETILRKADLGALGIGDFDGNVDGLLPASLAKGFPHMDVATACCVWGRGGRWG